MADPTLAQVRERDMDRCVRCGKHDSLHVHHRCLRSQGGRNGYANLVTLCSDCHNWAHSYVSQAREAGLILFANQDPERIPVAHSGWPAGPVYLRGDGMIDFWIPGHP